MASEYKTSSRRGSAAKPDDSGGKDEADDFDDLSEGARTAIEQYERLHEALRGPREKDFGKAPEKPRDGWKLPPPREIVERPV